MIPDRETDRAIVARQLGRPPRAFRRVAVRCPFGAPAVTEQDPYDPSGEPFPTTYYLTCRHVVAAVSRLEAAGGVERWTAAVAADPALASSVADADEAQRRVRRRLAAGGVGRDSGASLGLGVGGTSRGGSLKCLHAHVAFALARPGYELGERVVAELDPLWPDRCCSLPRNCGGAGFVGAGAASAVGGAGHHRRLDGGGPGAEVPAWPAPARRRRPAGADDGEGSA